MSTTIDDPKLEAPADEVVETAEIPEAPPALPGMPERPLPTREERPLTKEEILRPALGALMTTLGCAFLVGGMFTGLMPRVYAALGGMIGVAMAVIAARAQKRETLIQIASLLGIIFAGLLILGLGGGGGFDKVSDLGGTIGDAVGNARLKRPPAPFEAGWLAILPWTVGMIGYSAAWVGAMGRKPALGLLIPMPVIAFSAIAQPDEAQVPAGLVAFATFVIGLAIIYRADRGEGEGVSTAYEIKRAARTFPLVIVLIGALVALSKTSFLFPDPIYDPTQRAVVPKAKPLSTADDKVLFETSGEFTGPWRTGILSVYDGIQWRLPPFTDQSFQPVPLNGRVGEAFGNPVPPQVRSHVIIREMEGTVLPLPARMNAIRVENAPALVTDSLAETIRVDVGQVDEGLSYDAVFALLPTVETLQKAPPVADAAFLAEWTDTHLEPPPPAIVELLAKAPTTSTWDKLDFMRKKLLDTVTAGGAGIPVPVPPDKVEDIFTGSKEGTPFEIVAAQALIARWAGVPARIGYGFDSGDKKGAVFELHPKHGASWLEVYFQGHGWFPITGLPKKAKEIVGTSDVKRQVQVLPSEEIGVELFLPLRQTPKNLFFKQAQKIVLLALPFVVTILLIWLLWPVVVKARRKTRRQEWALGAGRAARIAVAYAELRDMATDLGVGDPYATPLAYLDMVIPDEEHQELAWLVTRCLWGDLRGNVTDDEVFASEELSRSLRRRIFEAQPFTIRGISFVSRLSLRNPYAPELLSPAIQKVSFGKLVRGLVPHIRLGVPHIRKKKEPTDEATETA